MLCLLLSLKITENKFPHQLWPYLADSVTIYKRECKSVDKIAASESRCCDKNTTKLRIRVNIANQIKAVDKVLNQAPAPLQSPHHAPKLIAVSKQQPKAKIDEALATGHKIFGENRLEEGLEHWKQHKIQQPELEIHFIGALQSKKAEAVVDFFDAIHSVDRPSLALALQKAMEKTAKRPDCFIQINTGKEEQKSGVLPHDADAFIHKCKQEWNLPIVGLMCLPPQGQNPVPHFAYLKQLATQHGLHQLSMGMSDDWELALRMGATHIRLGTAIFGARD